MRRVGSNAARALTLLEVVISIALIAMLLGALTTFFWQTLTIREQVAKDSDRMSIVRQMLNKIAAELRGCTGVESIGFPLQHFTADRRSITFVTAPLPPSHSYEFYRESQWELKPTPRHDMIEVTYSLWIDPEETTDEGEPLVGGILRTERRALEPYETEEDVREGEDLLYLRRDLWAPELGYLEFRFFDGVEWSTSWQVDEGNPVPHLVQITVGFDSITNDLLEDQDLEQYPLADFPLGTDRPDVNRWSIVVRLPAADQSFMSHVQRLGAEVEEVYQFNQMVEEDAGGEEGGG